jgi:hypothetical protein
MKILAPRSAGRAASSATSIESTTPRGEKRSPGIADARRRITPQAVALASRPLGAERSSSSESAACGRQCRSDERPAQSIGRLVSADRGHGRCFRQPEGRSSDSDEVSQAGRTEGLLPSGKREPDAQRLDPRVRISGNPKSDTWGRDGMLTLPPEHRLTRVVDLPRPVGVIRVACWSRNHGAPGDTQE